MSIETATEKLIQAQTLIVEALRELPQPKPPRARPAPTRRRASAAQSSEQ